MSSLGHRAAIGAAAIIALGTMIVAGAGVAVVVYPGLQHQVGVTTIASALPTNSSLISTASRVTSAGMSYQIPESNDSTSNSTNGLSLNLSLTGFSNGTIKITAYEFNPLQTTVNITAASAWPYPGRAFLQSYPSNACTSSTLPIGISILKGYAKLSDYGSLAPLTLNNSALQTPSCPPSSQPTLYSFVPSSYAATLYAGQNTIWTTAIFGTYLGSGYWTTNASAPPNSPPEFHLFPPGNYTVVAGDEWGQAVLLHFGVVQGSSQTPVTSSSSGNNTSTTQGPFLSLVTVSGSITVPTGSGSGVLLVTVDNGATSPIVSITIGVNTSGNGMTSGVTNGVTTNETMYASSSGSTSVGPTSQLVMYEGNLPIGQAASASATISPVFAGGTYTFTITITFAGGGYQIQTLSIVAQI